MATFTIITPEKSSHCKANKENTIQQSMKGGIKQKKTLKLRSLSSKKDIPSRSAKKQKAKMQKRQAKNEKQQQKQKMKIPKRKQKKSKERAQESWWMTAWRRQERQVKDILDFTQWTKRQVTSCYVSKHVEHDMNDDMGERTMTNTTNANGEQTESVIETEHHDEELLAQCTRSDEEAGSIVLHVSSDMNEKEKDDEEADETAAAKETEEIPKEDVEIRRLIEERRNTPKEEKQRLKEVSKCKKNVSETEKNEKTADIQRILEDFKGVKNIPGIKSAKKRVLITKIKNEKGRNLTKGIAKELRRQRKSRDWTRIRWERKWEQHRRAQQQHQCDGENPRDHDRRVANCNQQTQKKANLQTATESEQKTSKHAMMRREKWRDKSSTKS